MMRLALTALLALVALSTLTPPVLGQKQEQQRKTLAKVEPVTLVGLLTRQYRGRCGADGQHKWDDEHWEVGFVRLDVPASLDLSGMEGKAVVVTGVPAASRPAPEPEIYHEAARLNPSPEGPGIECPQYQMRSDWVISKNGFRIMRERSAGLPALLKVSQAELFGGLDLEVLDSGLKVTFTNTLKRKLSGLELKLHYEGCYGKPGTDTRVEKPGTLEPGKAVSVTFPKTVSRDQGQWGLRHHRAFSLQIAATPGKVLFDCDLQLSLFETTGIECPQE